MAFAKPNQIPTELAVTHNKMNKAKATLRGTAGFDDLDASIMEKLEKDQEGLEFLALASWCESIQGYCEPIRDMPETRALSRKLFQDKQNRPDVSIITLDTAPADQQSPPSDGTGELLCFLRTPAMLNWQSERDSSRSSLMHVVSVLGIRPRDPFPNESRMTRRQRPGEQSCDAWGFCLLYVYISESLYLCMCIGLIMYAAPDQAERAPLGERSQIL